jgi:hypothetical protein
MLGIIKPLILNAIFEMMPQTETDTMPKCERENVMLGLYHSSVFSGSQKH